jgi:hypothetical protein
VSNQTILASYIVKLEYLVTKDGEENDQAHSGLLATGAPGASCAWAPLPGSLLLRWRSMSLMNTQRMNLLVGSPNLHQECVDQVARTGTG